MTLHSAVDVALLRGEQFTRKQALALAVEIVSDPCNLEYDDDGGPKLDDCAPLVEEFERIGRSADVPGMDDAHGKLAVSVAALLFYVSRPSVAPRIMAYRANGN